MHADQTLAPVAPAGADDDDDETKREVHGDDLADAVEVGAGGRPVLRVDGAFECEPGPMKQPDEERDHDPGDQLHDVEVSARTHEAAEYREHHRVTRGEQCQDRGPY